MKLVLDPGHGGTDPGAVFGALYEKTICLAIAIRTARLLTSVGHIALLTRTDDSYVPISKRADFANDWKAELFLSIHCNADADPDQPGMPEAKGNEIWIFPGSVRGRMFAECLQRAAMAYFPGHKRRGIKEEAELGVLRLTNMPAALLEVAFIDTQESYKLAHMETQARIARAIASAVQEYAGKQ